MSHKNTLLMCWLPLVSLVSACSASRLWHRPSRCFWDTFLANADKKVYLQVAPTQKLVFDATRLNGSRWC